MKSKQNNSNNSKAEILIVEDSRTQAERLKLLLEDAGYSVYVADNGKAALQILETKRPALIISDIIMPEMNGYEFCKSVKSNPDIKDIPVILLTSLSSAHDIVKGLECGADNFIRKPYEAKYLLQRIHYILTNRSIREKEKVQMGISLDLGGERHFITSERQQILDLLVSTYEDAVILNIDLEDSNRSLNGLFHISEGLNKAVSVHQVCETALYRAMELPSVQAGWIFLKDEEGKSKLAYEVNMPEELIAEESITEECQCQHKLFKEGVNRETSIFECSRLEKAKLDNPKLKYHVSIPLLIDDKVVGIMNLVGPDNGLFDDDELQILNGIGHQVAVALERANLYENLEQLVDERTAALQAEINERTKAEANIKKLNRVYSVLSNINQCIVRERELVNIYKEACRIAIDEGGFLFASLGLLDIETNRFHVATQAAMPNFDTACTISLNDELRENNDLILKKLLSENHLIINDIENDEFFSSFKSSSLKSGCKSIAVFPLKLFGELKGTYNLFSSELNFFDERELRLLDELAMDISFAMEFAEREKQRKTSEEERSRLISILEATPDFVAMNDLDGYATYINSAGWKMLGVDNPETINKWHMTQCHPKSVSDYLENEVIPVVLKEGVWSGETVILSRDGKETPVSQVIIAHTNPEGEVEYLSTIMRDLTESKKTERELVLAKEKAEEMNKLKSNFFATMSHELRTPFVGIMGYAELLVNELGDPETKEMAEGILRTSIRMKNTLTKILNLSKYEFSGVELVTKKVDVDEILNIVYKQFEKAAEKKKLEFKVHKKFKSLSVETDESILLDILNNLVSNAIIYTNEGEIEILAEEKIESGENILQIKVSDTGIGIPIEKQEIIWEEFRQVSEGMTRSYQGTGLGLSIVKKYTELLGGNIYLESEEGKGSTFTFELPT